MKIKYTPGQMSSGSFILLIFSVVSMMFVSSCEDIINYKQAGNPTKYLVVDGSITTDTSAHQVILSYSGDFFNMQVQNMAAGAEVSITDGNNVFPLHETTPGNYYTDSTVFGVVGKTYTLNIKLADGREFSGSDELRRCVAIDSIRQTADYNHLPNMGTGGYGYDVLYYGPEPQPAGDCYLWLLYVNNKLYTDTITEWAFTTDEFVNGNYIRDFAVYTIREGDLEDTSLVTLEMLSTTKEYNDFLTGILLETKWRGSPWDGPPANVPGNMSNGALGFFSASAVQRKSRYFHPTPRTD